MAPSISHSFPDKKESMADTLPGTLSLEDFSVTDPYEFQVRDL